MPPNLWLLRRGWLSEKLTKLRLNKETGLVQNLNAAGLLRRQAVGGKKKTDRMRKHGGVRLQKLLVAVAVIHQPEAVSANYNTATTAAIDDHGDTLRGLKVK